MVLLLLPESDYVYYPQYLVWMSLTKQKTVQGLIKYKDIAMFMTVITGAVCYAMIIVFILATVGVFFWSCIKQRPAFK